MHQQCRQEPGDGQRRGARSALRLRDRLNFKGPFRLATQVAKRMAAADGGSIINVSSTVSVMPLPMVISYGSSCALARS